MCKEKPKICTCCNAPMEIMVGEGAEADYLECTYCGWKELL